MLVLAASCQKDGLATPEMLTDKGQYEVAQAGGEVVVKLKATRDWTTQVTPATSLDVTDGITVEPASGKASADFVEVVVKAEANTSYDRTVLVSFISDGISAAVTVSQKGILEREPEKLTVAQFLEKAEDPGIWYELTGMIKNVASEEYGNFDLVDETGKVYVYGLTAEKVAKNDKSYSSLGLKEGDIVTLKGTRSSYNGSPQVGGPAYYVSHEEGEGVTVTKATIAEFMAAEDGSGPYRVEGFIKTISVSEQYGNADIVIMDGVGNEIKLYRAKDSKGGIDELKGLKPMDKVTAVGGRSAYNGAPQMPQGCYVESSQSYTEISIADFLVADDIKTTYYRVKGTLKSIVDGDISASYNNANLTITDGTNDLYLFRLGPGVSGKKIDELGLAEGVEIVVVGQRDVYKDAVQMPQGGQFVQIVEDEEESE